MAHPQKHDFMSRADALTACQGAQPRAVFRAHHPAPPEPRPAAVQPGPASKTVQLLKEPRAGREKSPPGGAVPLCAPPNPSLVPPPPSTADSSGPSTGLTCCHGNRNPGLRQPLVLPPVITSSLKCKAS